MRAYEAEEGFTLLEVVIAVAILATSLAAIYPIFSASNHRLNQIDIQATALTFAQSVLYKQALSNNWVALPIGEEAAVWQLDENNMQWKAFVVPSVAVEDESASSAPGHPVHLRVLVKHEGLKTQQVVLDEVFWVQGS